jgi:hypothetical protein
MHVGFTIVDAHGGRRKSIGHNIRLYTLTEISRMLSRAGFHDIASYGGFNGEPYSIETRRMIICAERLA